jgi:hypothetical protein
MGLHQEKDQGITNMIEQNGGIAGYSASIGILGHAVANSNEELKVRIINTFVILGHDFLLPAQNYKIINWLVEWGFQIGCLQI